MADQFSKSPLVVCAAFEIHPPNIMIGLHYRYINIWFYNKQRCLPAPTEFEANETTVLLHKMYSLFLDFGNMSNSCR